MRLTTHSNKLIPLALSAVSAGYFAEIGDEYEMLDVNHSITRGREGFAAYPVTGDSMVNTINPGDTVFVDTWAQAKHGDLVAVYYNGLTCVKIFEQKPHGLYLVSANKSYEPRRVTAKDDLRVLGVVRGHLALY